MEAVNQKQNTDDAVSISSLHNECYEAYTSNRGGMLTVSRAKTLQYYLHDKPLIKNAIGHNED